MATNAFQMRNSAGLSKAVYCRTLASASSERMKNRRAASEREWPGHYVQLRLRENLLDLLEQSCPRWQKLRPITISFS
jgi:uncharacterized protein (DUF4415 family)